MFNFIIGLIRGVYEVVTLQKDEKPLSMWEVGLDMNIVVPSFKRKPDSQNIRRVRIVVAISGGLLYQT
ncbi:hypothetical protein [Paenibacillus sp. GSMTC-2017]|uniref:hypothetical protein n=1 Tax=Paenibacillus sp. GSMTC-2017 TaxID=2794350 RepID=UPI001E4213B1|nr:hypothetical protein [Paenibacillus sp. GSMTC-2017]